MKVPKRYIILFSIGCALACKQMVALPIYHLNITSEAPAKEFRSQLSIKIRPAGASQARLRTPRLASVGLEPSINQSKKNFIVIVPPPLMMFADMDPVQGSGPWEQRYNGGATKTSLQLRRFLPTDDYHRQYDILSLVFNLTGKRTFQEVIQQLNARKGP